MARCSESVAKCWRALHFESAGESFILCSGVHSRSDGTE